MSGRTKPGVPARQVRRFWELEGSQGVWSLAVHKEHERVREMDSVLVSSQPAQTTVRLLAGILEVLRLITSLTDLCHRRRR
jgi:hypothetical protein